MNRQLQKDFRILGKMGEGTFSEVFKCQKIADDRYYACKKMKQRYDSKEQVDSLREIQSMKKLSHPNVIRLEEIIYDARSGSLALLLELMDMNIYELIRGRKHFLSDTKVCLFMWQLCQALDHVHSRGVFHRDVKPENILIKGETLKLADFGSCRSINSRQPYTEYISTRWYRAPECLLTDGCYSYQMDCWSAGCVMYEIMNLKPLFPGSNEVDQIAKIHDVIGTPNSDVLLKFKKKRAMSVYLYDVQFSRWGNCPNRYHFYRDMYSPHPHVPAPLDHLKFGIFNRFSCPSVKFAQKRAMSVYLYDVQFSRWGNCPNRYHFYRDMYSPHPHVPAPLDHLKFGIFNRFSCPSVKFAHKTRAIPFNFPKKKGSGIERLLPSASSEAIDLIKRFCEYDPDKRLTAKYSLKHPYFKVMREKHPINNTRENVSPVHSRENKENLPLVTDKASDVSSVAMKSIDPQKEKDRRKKRRKAAPYYSQGSTANLTFPSLFTKNQSGPPLGQSGYSSSGLPKMHLPTLFPNSQLPTYKSRSKNDVGPYINFQTGNSQYHSFFRRLPASEKHDYTSYSLHSHQMK